MPKESREWGQQCGKIPVLHMRQQRLTWRWTQISHKGILKNQQNDFKKNYNQEEIKLNHIKCSFKFREGRQLRKKMEQIKNAMNRTENSCKHDRY